MTEDRSERYRRFVESSPARDDGYLFDQPRVRFRAEPGDELVAAALRAEESASGVRVQAQGGSLELRGLPPQLVQSAFAALAGDGCSYSRLLALLGPSLEPFLEQTFGQVVFAPAAVASLEVELPSLEIVRFPGSPYEVERPYWRNMSAVRRCIQRCDLRALDTAALRALLLELHRVALLGEASEASRSSFYLPASALGRKRPTPGVFYDAPSQLTRWGDAVLLTGGARVSAPLLGGPHYWRLLAESVSDEGALEPERRLGVGGLDWGGVVDARAADEAERRAWFIPPRPLQERHFAALSSDLRRAGDAEAARDAPAALSALGAFHYRFVRVHPLPSANQSLAMSFVNAALGRLLGVGIPHLLLDQLALRFELGAYQRLFARAARAWSVPVPSPAQRQMQLVRLRGELNAFVAELGRASSLLEARALLPERLRAAQLALLRDA